jgi:hypothetical protein
MEKVVLKETVVSGNTRNNNKNYNKNRKPKKKIENGENNNHVKNDFLLIKGIKMIGSYKIGSNYFIYLQKKPNIIHRFFSKLLLGWVWKDVK